MAAITSAGVGSGLNLEGIIKATLDAENLPKLQKFAKLESKYSVELSGIGSIKSALDALNTQATALSDINNFNKRTATITQPTTGDIISATTNTNSTSGNFAVEVVNLSQGSRAVSGAGLFTASTNVVSTTGGNLTISAGTQTPFSVAITAGATLDDVRNAINSASGNFGISANIINTGGATPESKLVITSSVTGTGNDISINNDIAELDKVSTTAFAGGAGGLAIAVADQAKDANIKVDGISASSSSNIFTNAIQDITITALAPSQSSATANLVVATDKAGVSTTIDSFVSAFNTAVGTIDNQIKLGGGLAGDSALRNLKSNLISKLSTVVSGAGSFQTLYDIGLGLDKNSQLVKTAIVRSVSDALTSSYSDVGTLFTDPTSGVGTAFSGLLTDYLQTSGPLTTRTNSLNDQIKQVATDRANHTYNMSQLEKTLRKKYSSLDVLISQLKSTGTFLTGQLASLPGFG